MPTNEPKSQADPTLRFDITPIGIDEPAVPRIYLNNSSLRYLACTRRYVYQVVRGAIVPGDTPRAIGSLFHAYMKEIVDGDEPLTLAGQFATQRFVKEKAAVADATLHLKIADLACKVRDQLGLVDGDAVIREYFFEYPIFVEVEGVQVTVTICGTRDLSSTLPSGIRYIREFKTTKKQIDADFIINYNLESQIFFYAATAEMMSPTGNAYARSYTFVNYVQGKIVTTEPEYISPDTINEWKGIISEKAHLAAYLHKYPERSSKDGMTNGACFFCPFKPICALHDAPKEAEAIDKWYLGFKPYDPQHR